VMLSADTSFKNFQTRSGTSVNWHWTCFCLQSFTYLTCCWFHNRYDNDRRRSTRLLSEFRFLRSIAYFATRLIRVGQRATFIVCSLVFTRESS